MKLKAMTLPVFALIAAFAAIGCESTNTNAKPEPKLSAAQIRINPTPRLQSLTRSYEENSNLITRTQDNRIRGIHDDIQMIFFLNRNTGLTEFDYPVR